ncbi:MAG: O-antigen ligase family protein [Paracoccaceae bacterium]
MTTAGVHPAALPAAASVTPARLIVALVALRWLAGIADNMGARGASEAAAVAMLAALGLMLLNRMRLARDAALLMTGLLAWLFTGTLSALSTDMARPIEAAALLTLLLLYALFANAALTYLRQPAALVPLRRFLTAFVAVGGALALVQVLSGSAFVDPGKPGVIRAFGSDVHPVSFAIQMLAALLALEVIRAKTGERFGAGHVALLALGAAALYLTFARTAWVMALVVLALLAWRRGRGAQRLALVALALPLGIVGLTVSDRFADLSSLPLFWQNFSFADTVFDYRYIDNSVSWRIVNWSYGLQQAMEQPLLGFGPGQSADASHFNLEMHNLLLEGFFEGGVLGLTALLVTLAGLVRIHLRLPNATPADAYARALAGGFGPALLFAVLFSTSLVDQLMTVLMYLILLAVAGTPAEAPPKTRPLSWLPPGSP